MSMKYKKELSYVCLGISITAMLLYFYLTIENYLNFSGIVMFSVLICSTLILGVCLQNRLYDTQKQTRNLRLMWIVLFSFYIFQMIYILFFASEFARDYVDLRSQSYPDALNQSEAVRNHSSDDGDFRYAVCGQPDCRYESAG